ncbi:MAG: small basic family protein [Armatimonadota bacterium]
MWLPIVALIIGFVMFYLPHIPIQYDYIPYIGLAVVAGLDSLAGAIRSIIEGKFNDRVFVSGFFSNTVIAALLLFLGNKLEIPYVGIAIMVALVIRIFNNLGFIRRYVIARLFEKRISAEKVFPEP